MNYENQAKEWRMLQKKATDLRLDLIEAMSEDPKIPQIKGMGSWFEIGSWDCPTSPIKVCIYHRIEDPPCDFCLFCGLPDERK